MIKLKSAFFVFFVLFLTQTKITWASNYYVATNGSDSNAGSETQPWLTIQKAANTAVSGDTVFIKEGYYRGAIIFKKFGTSTNPITFKAYENNNPPVIHYSEMIQSNETNNKLNTNGWSLCTSCGSNIYQATLVTNTITGNSFEIGHIIFTDNNNKVTIMKKNTTQAGLTTGTFYHAPSTSTIYAWFPENANPVNAKEIGLLKYWRADNEHDYRYNYMGAPGLLTFDSKYVNVSNFVLKYSQYFGASFRGDFNSLDNAIIQYSRYNGVDIGEKRPNTEDVVTTSGSTASRYGSEIADVNEGNSLTNSEVSNSSMKNFPRGSRWINTTILDWGGGIALWSARGTKLLNNNVNTNHGEGIILMGYRDSEYAQPGCSNISIVGNKVYDNWSWNIIFDYANNSQIDRNLIYVSGQQPALDTNKIRQIAILRKTDPDEFVKAYISFNNPGGICMAEENDFGQAGDLTDNTLTNNILINNRPGLRYWFDPNAASHWNSSSYAPGLKNTIIAHNTLINNANDSVSDRDLMIIDTANHINTQIRNNIFVQHHATTPNSSYLLLLNRRSSATNLGDGITFSHNLWYFPQKASPMNWYRGSTNTNYSITNWSANKENNTSKDGNPFSSTLTTDRNDITTYLPTTYQLAINSIAINAGYSTTLTNHDYAGVTRPYENVTDIGAFEYSPNNPIITSVISTIISEPTYSRYDLNKDGKVDFTDINLFLGFWQAKNTTSDFNNDSVINSFDYALMEQAYTQ